MSDLWEKLQAARSRVSDQSQTLLPPQRLPEDEEAPTGWSWFSPLVAWREFTFELEVGFWELVGPGLEPADWQGRLCFDTETTGLSGGAGTVAFLVGWASMRPSGGTGRLPKVTVTQWFLRDLPGEPDMIAALDPVFHAAKGLVSFNGASFDLPLLRSRWALAGREFPDLEHHDDLHMSRRLWKRVLPTCKLSELERSVLGLHRLDDVPGALVPALWFDYLRQGAAANFAAPLEGVLRHHAQDVYSLLCLDLLLAALKGRPEDSRWVGTHRLLSPRRGLARLAAEGLLHPDLAPAIPVDFWGLLALLPTEAGEKALEAAWEQQGTEALGLAWAQRLKRRRDPRCLALWEQLWHENRSFPALIEGLKWLEHRDGSPEAIASALNWIEGGLAHPLWPASWRESLLKRRERLSTRRPQTFHNG
ncbi:MAG: ribonuclease H-like domain-containing protein [Spirochaetales bacterium]